LEAGRKAQKELEVRRREEEEEEKRLTDLKYALELA
jgi:hypothetical protein